MDLKFRIRGQALNAYIPDPMVSETVDYYRALFSFSPDWDGLDKWLHLKDSDGNTYDAELVEDMVSPLNLTAGLWEAWLHGHEMTDGQPTLRITTGTVSFRITQSGALEGGEVLPVIEATVAEQVASNAAYAKAMVEKLVAESEALFEAAAKAETYMENAQGSAEAAHVDAQGAHQAREAIEGMSVETIALDPGSEATVEKTMLGDFVKLIFGLPRGERGTVGPKGDPGTSVVALARTAGDSSPGTFDTYTLLLSDGKTFDILVYNGANGKDGAGDMTSATYDPQGKATDVFGYVDEKIAAIPAPDVSGPIGNHNTDEAAHADIRETVSGKAAAEHGHDAKDITSGVLSAERGGTGGSSALTNAGAYAILRKAGDGNYMYYTNTANGAFFATGENAQAKFGTLPVAQGGTGATTFTSGRALIGAGTGAVTTRAITNSTAATTAITASTNLVTMNTLRYALNRTTGPGTADTNYATAMMRAIKASTTDLTAGTSELTSGQIYLVYE